LHLPDVVAERSNSELVPNAGLEPGRRYEEDSVTSVGKLRHELLRPLPTEVPIDDREADHVVGGQPLTERRPRRGARGCRPSWRRSPQALQETVGLVG